MKLLISSVSTLVATTVVATAQISGLSINLISGFKQIGSIALHPSTCGIIGAFTLIGLIGARRLRVRS